MNRWTQVLPWIPVDVADALRTGCITVAGIIVVTALWSMRTRSTSHRQQARYLGLALFAVAAIYTEIDRFHTGATIRLPVTVFAVLASMYGLSHERQS
jgi:chromate transport protein ChrA